MIEQKHPFDSNKTVLDQIVDAHDLSYKEFAEKLGFTYKALGQYRRGKREFRLNMEQIKIMNQFLGKIGLTIDDLPSDWILDSSYKSPALKN